MSEGVVNGEASSEGTKDSLRTIPLLNSMVDVVIVFGFDETCSRELVILDEDEDLDVNFDTISQRELKLHFLQVLTPGQAYPERCCVSSLEQSGEFLTGPSNHPQGPNSPERGREEMGSSPIPSGDKKNFNVEDFGLTWETIETMHFFIFPEGKNKSQATPPSPQTPQGGAVYSTSTVGPHIYSNVDDLPPSILPLLFTNILAERSFACVLRFPRPFFMHRNSKQSHYTLTPWSPLITPPHASCKLVYLPTCTVLISKRPCFQFMKDALSGFHNNLVEQCEDFNFWRAVKMFSERIFLVPTPPPGSLSLEFQLPGFLSNLIVRPPRGGIPVAGASGISHTPPHPDQYLDIRFNYPFMCLSIDHVLQVVSALLTGQCVLFVSSLYPMLTYVIQSFLTYIKPFVWRHSVIPILPYPLLEVLDAPVATVIGIHTSLTSEPEFKRVENAVIVDLDKDELTVRLDDGASLPPLPKAAVDNFKQKYLILQKQAYEIEAMQRLSPISIDKQLKEREAFEQNMDDALSKLFLELMVRSFHKVIRQLLKSRVRYEEAIKAMSLDDQTFYRQMESTDAFTGFYQSQRLGVQSDFNLLAIRLERDERRLNSDTDMDYYRPRSTNTLQSGSLPSWLTLSRRFSAQPVSIKTSDSFFEDSSIHRASPLTSMGVVYFEPSKMELPALGAEFRGREEFLDEVIEILNELKKNKVVEAQCVYLRGFYLLCKRDVKAALEDHFETLRRLDVTLVPQASAVKGLLHFLSTEEKEALVTNTHLKALQGTRRITNPPSMAIDLGKTMPKKPINHANFLKLVQQNAIALDAESAANLHHVLSLGSIAVVSPETFKTFYRAWKLVLEDNKNAELPNIELGKAEKGKRISERVLAVAHCIRTNFGSQSTLVLTTYRLLAVTGFSAHVMANFSVPIRFENFSYATNFIGVKNPGIRIEILTKQKTDKKKSQDLYMAFQDSSERDNWYHMLKEMLSGWGLSQRLKDPCVMETAQGHVILQNAMNQSGLLDQFNHAQRRKRALKLLSFQSKDVSEVNRITGEALQYRINPCLHETDRQTVESLLYIPPIIDDDGGQGKLWIGLGNGRLKVYDLESRCFESDIKITESKHGRSVRLSCLLLVNQHVWVGSFSRNIHILDSETVCHVSQLSFLEDAPRDMALSGDGQVVWSLLLNGCVLGWDPITRKRISKFQVRISDGSQYTNCTCFTIWRDQIWVGTNRGSITVMDSQSGAKITELFFPGNSRRQVEIKHLAVSTEDEVWCSVYSIPKSEDSTFIAVFNPHTTEKKMQYSKLDNRVSIILPVKNSMWCGTKSGKIYIFHAKTYAEREGMPKILSAHEDFIRTMTLTDINLVISGSGSNDGYAAVWKAIEI